MLKRSKAIKGFLPSPSAAFGRLRVETPEHMREAPVTGSAAFGRLRVETPSVLAFKPLGVSAAFGRLRVETN